MQRATMPRALRARAEGFTLLEIMIALAILGFGLLAMAAMQITAMSGGRAGRHTTQAAVMARDQMETFQRVAWSSAQLAATAGWSAPITVDNTPDGGAGAEQSYAAVSRRVTQRGQDVERDRRNAGVGAAGGPPVFRRPGM